MSQIAAYLYSDPLLEPAPDPGIWGWEVDRIYQDLGSRQQLQLLLQDCQGNSPQEKFNYLLLRHWSDLGDSLQEIGDRLKLLTDQGVQVVAIEQTYQTSQTSQTSSNPTNQQSTDLLHLLQEIQASQQSRRLKQGHAQNRLQALPPPGKAPYGYRRGQDRYLIDRSTAPVIKDFFEYFLLYGSLRGAVRHLQKKYGKKISATTGQRWLNNPVYRGHLAYNTGEVITNTHAPLINPEEAAQIDRLLRRNSRLPPRTASAPRSLAGLVICGECRSTMTITRVSKPRKKGEYLYLRPRSCGRFGTNGEEPNGDNSQGQVCGRVENQRECPQKKCGAIAYDSVFRSTVAKIAEELPKAVAGVSLPNLEVFKGSITSQISRNQEILTQLPKLVTQGILDQETANLRVYKLRTEISQLELRLAQLPPGNLVVIAQNVTLPQFWLDLSETERRFYLREFIQKVVINRQGENWSIELEFIFYAKPN